MVEISACILTENECYQMGQTIIPKGIMVHSTGANNPNLSRYVGPDDGVLGENPNGNHWNHAGVNKCVHAFVGKDAMGKARIYQTLPWNWRGWHAGGSANNTHISYEICEDDLSNSVYFLEVYHLSVRLTAYLCKEYGLDPMEKGVIICHSEGYDAGVASNHGDVMHWFPRYGKSMDSFRNDVKNEMEDEEMTDEKFDAMMKRWMERQGALPASSWAEGGIDKAKSLGITDGTRPLGLATRQEVALMVAKMN